MSATSPYTDFTGLLDEFVDTTAFQQSQLTDLAECLDENTIHPHSEWHFDKRAPLRYQNQNADWPYDDF